MAINRKAFSAIMFFSGALLTVLVWGFTTKWKFVSSVSLAGKDCTVGGKAGKTDDKGVCKA